MKILELPVYMFNSFQTTNHVKPDIKTLIVLWSLLPCAHVFDNANNSPMCMQSKIQISIEKTTLGPFLWMDSVTGKAIKKKEALQSGVERSQRVVGEVGQWGHVRKRRNIKKLDELMMNLQEGSQELRECVCVWKIHSHTLKEIRVEEGGEGRRGERRGEHREWENQK